MNFGEFVCPYTNGYFLYVVVFWLIFGPFFVRVFVPLLGFTHGFGLLSLCISVFNDCMYFTFDYYIHVITADWFTTFFVSYLLFCCCFRILIFCRSLKCWDYSCVMRFTSGDVWLVYFGFLWFYHLHFGAFDCYIIWHCLNGLLTLEPTQILLTPSF